MAELIESCYCFVLIDRDTDLPLLVSDTAFDIMVALHCKRTTVWNLMTGKITKCPLAKKYKVEKVYIPSDEEVENWFLTKDKDCAIISEVNPSGVTNPPNYTKFGFCIIGRIANTRAMDVSAPLIR